MKIFISILIGLFSLSAFANPVNIAEGEYGGQHLPKYIADNLPTDAYKNKYFTRFAITTRENKTVIDVHDKIRNITYTLDTKNKDYADLPKEFYDENLFEGSAKKIREYTKNIAMKVDNVTSMGNIIVSTRVTMGWDSNFVTTAPSITARLISEVRLNDRCYSFRSSQKETCITIRDIGVEVLEVNTGLQKGSLLNKAIGLVAEVLLGISRTSAHGYFDDQIKIFKN